GGVKPGVMALGVEEQRRMERREVWCDGWVVRFEEVGPVLANLEVAGHKEDHDVGIDQESEQAEQCGQRPEPPEVFPLRRAKAGFKPRRRRGAHLCHEVLSGRKAKLIRCNAWSFCTSAGMDGYIT